MYVILYTPNHLHTLLAYYTYHIYIYIPNIRVIRLEENLLPLKVSRYSIYQVSAKPYYKHYLGPLPKTTVDFWWLVWQEKPHIIAMVTNLEEGTKKKCHQYWPDTDTQSFGPFQVKITSEQILVDYTTRNLSVQV